MEGFGLLIGHLLGDYILQNDWMATNKANPHPGPRPLCRPPRVKDGTFVNDVVGEASDVFADVREQAEYEDKLSLCRKGRDACLLHCALYTFAVWMCSCWWMPWWGPIVCFAAHYPMDRFGLARRWMSRSGQEGFAKNLGPWSVIVVDNTVHLFVLFVIGLYARI